MTDNFEFVAPCLGPYTKVNIAYVQTQFGLMKSMLLSAKLSLGGFLATQGILYYCMYLHVSDPTFFSDNY